MSTAAHLASAYFSAYRKYVKNFNVLVQFCLAHFLRDVRFLVEHPNSRNQVYGKRVLERLRALFAVIDRREVLGEAAFKIGLQNAGFNQPPLYFAYLSHFDLLESSVQSSGHTWTGIRCAVPLCIIVCADARSCTSFFK